MSQPLVHVFALAALAMAHVWIAAVVCRWHLHLWSPGVSHELFRGMAGIAVAAALALVAVAAPVDGVTLDATVGAAMAVGLLVASVASLRRKRADGLGYR